MVVAEQTLYVGTAILALVGAVGIAVFAQRFDGAGRRHVLILPVLLGVLALGYLGMALDLFVETSAEGEPVYFTRFGVYLVTYTLLMGYIGLVAGAEQRHRLILPVVVAGFTIGATLGQLTAPPVETLGTLLVLVSLGVAVWALFGPLDRATESVSGDRQLLFAKLRNLALLVLIMYLLIAITNRAALGLLDAFIGIFTVTYVDFVGHFGLVALIVYSRTAVEDVASEYSSPLQLFTKTPK